MPQGECWTILHICSALLSCYYFITTKLTKKDLIDVILQLYTFAEGFFTYSESHTSIQLTLKGNAASVFIVVLFEWNVNKNNKHIKKGLSWQGFFYVMTSSFIPVFPMHSILHIPKWTPTHLTVFREVVIQPFSDWWNISFYLIHPILSWIMIRMYCAWMVLSILKNCQKHGWVQIRVTEQDECKCKVTWCFLKNKLRVFLFTFLKR